MRRQLISAVASMIVTATLIVPITQATGAAASAVSPISSRAICPSEESGGELIDFDFYYEESTPLAKRFRSQGVRFVDDARSTPRAVTDTRQEWNGALGQQTDRRHPNPSPIVMRFDKQQKTVGFDMINLHSTRSSVARVTAYDGAGRSLGTTSKTLAPGQSAFAGFAGQNPQIAQVKVDYEADGVAEVIDDLCFGRDAQLPEGVSSKLKPPAVVDLEPQRDLALRGVEVTQAVQCFDQSQGDTNCADNSLKLALNKSTWARVYGAVTGSGSDIANVGYRLYMRAGAKIWQWDHTAAARKTFARGLGDAANFGFLPNFSGPVTTEIWAVIDPDNKVKEADETNNRWPRTGVLNVTFLPTKRTNIVGRMVNYVYLSPSEKRQATGSVLSGTGADWLEQILPVADGSIDYRLASGTMDWDKYFSNAGDLISRLNVESLLARALDSIWTTGDPVADADHLYGYVPPKMESHSGYAGYSDPVWYGGLGIAAWGLGGGSGDLDGPDLGDFVFGHEITHDLNLRHPATSDSCGSKDGKSKWPYANAQIQETGVNTRTGFIYDHRSHDVQSYCPPTIAGWVSPFQWKNLFDWMQESSQPTVADAAPLANPYGLDSIVLDVTVRDDGTASLGVGHRVDASIEEVNPRYDETSPYAVELRAGAAVLARFPFNVDFSRKDETLAPHMSTPMILPFDDATTSIVVTNGTQVLAERLVSPSEPSVVVGPVPSSVGSGSTFTLGWSGSDPDGGSLTYSVLYSIDDTTWEVLGTNIAGTTLDVDVDSLAGSEAARFRVVASDGVNIGYGESDAVAVPDQLPMVHILAPEGGDRAGEGVNVTLRGGGTDREEGSLPEASLEWSSDRQGILGYGSMLQTDDLLAGRHTIRLRGYQLDGRYTERSVTLDVVSVAAPVLTPSPSGAGSPVVARATITSPFAAGELQCTVNYGDGSGDRNGTISGRTCTGPQHTYGKTGSFPVVISVGDSFTEHTFSSVMHTVIDDTAPNIEFVRGHTSGVYVANSAFVEGGPTPIMVGGVAIEVAATDGESPVTGVQFFVDGVARGMGAYDPSRKVYSFTFRSPSPGSHEIRATATNAFGLTASKEITVLGISP